MHELAVTENILEIAIRHGSAAGATNITDIYLVVGNLSSIIDDSVQFYWDIVSKGTVAEGAMLHFHRKSAEIVCRDCGHQFTPVELDLSCPRCRSTQVEIIAGQEFYLEAIEVET